MKSKIIISFFLILALVLLIISGAFTQSGIKEKTLLGTTQYIPDIATFLQIGQAAPAGYSWDGQNVYFISSMSGANQVYRINTQGWPYQLSTFEDGLDFFVLSWGGDMAIVGASIGGSEQSQLYLMDTKTGRTVQITHFDNIQFGSVVWNIDDQSIFYRSNEENKKDFHLYQKDIVTGETRKIMGDTAGVHGTLSIADLSQDGRYMLVYLYTSNVNNDLYLLNLENGESQLLNDDDGDVTYSNATLMPDNKTIWLTSNYNEDGINRLAKLKVGSPKVTFINDGWIDPKWEIENLGISRDYKYMAADVNENGYMRLKIREIETLKELPGPPLEGILGLGGWNKNGEMLISFNGPTRAQDIWHWNPFTQVLKQLTFSIYAGIDREMFIEPKLILYKSFDGLEIPAFLYLPPNYQEGKPVPFIVNAHGGPEGQFQPAFQRNIQYFLLNGYGILAPNPRGSSGYGLKYLNMDNYKNRKNSLKDYKAGVDYLIENKYTAPGMIAIRGGSYGGYVVMGMITEYPDLFSAAVNTVGIVNFQSFLEKTADYRRHLRESEYGPLSDPEFLKEISPIWKADQIKTPLLVVHGVNDPRVPIYEARQIIKAIIDKGGVVDSLIFPDEGHGTSKRVNIIAEYRKQVEFFDKNLKKE